MSGGPNKVVYMLLGIVGVLIVVVGVMLFGGSVFDQTPRTELERDYEMLLQALETYPDEPSVLMTLAEVEYEMGRRRDAMDHAARASEVATAVPNINLRYAQLLMQEDRLEEAEAFALREAELVGRSSGRPQFLLAQILREQGRLDEALEMMAVATQIDYFAADKKVLYAEMLVEAGREDEAIEQFQEARRFLPEDQRIIDGLEALGVEVEPYDGTNPHAPVGPPPTVDQLPGMPSGDPSSNQ